MKPDQSWFEMTDVRHRFYSKAVWIPLRMSKYLLKKWRLGYSGYEEEYYCAYSLAVQINSKQYVKEMDLTRVRSDLGHHGYIDNDDIYIPANVYNDSQGRFNGEHLVLSQHGNSVDKPEWHLAQDIALTLGLRREGNLWVRPEEGYAEIVKLEVNEKGFPVLMEIRAEHLRDYLAARKMALFISSYRHRVVVVEKMDGISWEDNEVSQHNDNDLWTGRITEICEGGMRFGSTSKFIHSYRTDVDPDEDVPEFEFPLDEDVQTQVWNKKHEGKKLYRIEGELWRNELIEPSSQSPRVRGDELPPTVFFITDASGKKETRETLIKGSRWLWFKPEVMMSLAHRRGGSLTWYTRDTGSVRIVPDYELHFGINKLGLVNIYAKDIAELPDWQQVIWSGYNVTPDGKVSEELLSSQMKSTPADTKAPEELLPMRMDCINEYSKRNFGFNLFKDHGTENDLIKHIHRFRAIDESGLFALAKDITKLIVERIDTKAIQTISPPPKSTKLGSLKSLERLVSLKTGKDDAHKMVGSLFGVYELRQCDAHLQSSDVKPVLELMNIDRVLPYVHQGYQMLHSCVSSLFQIADVLRKWND